MKKLFLLLVFASAINLVACENKESVENKENATLTITSDQTLELSHEACTLEIAYTLEGAKAGAKPTAKCNAEWISNLQVDQSITFSVAANEGEESRTAVILITYGSAQQQVILRQLSPSEAALKASYFGGEYYGSIYSPGMGNYYLHLSDNGFNDDGMDKPNSKYYCLDLYAPLYEGPEDGEISLPIGTYTLNTDSEPALWTMGWEYSGYRESDADGASYEPLRYDHASLTVTEEGATFECSIEGVKHRVKYTGKATIINALY